MPTALGFAVRDLGVQHGVQHQAQHRGADRDVATRSSACSTGIQHERRQQRRPRPQDQHAAPLAVAHLHQPVMEVPLVGGRHALTPAWPGG